ncbi:hypothetical protein JCM18899A_22760 [Nocardioides sp. AN3]
MLPIVVWRYRASRVAMTSAPPRRCGEGRVSVDVLVEQVAEASRSSGVAGLRAVIAATPLYWLSANLVATGSEWSVRSAERLTRLARTVTDNVP